MSAARIVFLLQFLQHCHGRYFQVVHDRFRVRALIKKFGNLAEIFWSGRSLLFSVVLLQQKQGALARKCALDATWEV